MGEKGSADDHYGAVLADLEAQRARIDAAIATINAVRSGAAIPIAQSTVKETSNLPTVTNGNGMVIGVDTFHKLTIPQAVRKYFAIRGREPAANGEIVEALKTGGQAGSEGENFKTVVFNALKRMESQGELTNVKRGLWGLAEWYDTKNED